MTAPEEKIVRIHSSSGTTGLPVIIPYTAKDVDDWAIMFKRCYEMAGMTNMDRIQITPGYGLWTAGIGFQAGAEKLGAMVVPMAPLLPMHFFWQRKLRNVELKIRFT